MIGAFRSSRRCWNWNNHITERKSGLGRVFGICGAYNAIKTYKMGARSGSVIDIGACDIDLSARFSLLGAKTLWGFVATVWSANMPCVK
jgi:hypothetical protein